MLSYTVPAVTAVEAQAYIDARLLSGWPALVADQNAALRRGQDYIAREYNHRWRVEFTDTTAPDIVKFAIIEAALVEARSPNSLSPMVTAATAKVLTEVKGIKWTPISGKSMGSAPDMMKPTLTNIAAMLEAVAGPEYSAAILVV